MYIFENYTKLIYKQLLITIMTKKFSIAIVAIMALCLTANADPIKIKGVYNNNRYDDHADHWYSTFVGWNSTLGKAIFVAIGRYFMISL